MHSKIILEFGCNHQGSVTIAKEMIDQAAALGVWAVKFQKRSLNNITPAEGEQPRSLKNSFGPTFLQHRQALEFGLSNLSFLKEYTESKGLVFICTAFDLESFFLLANELKCEYIKLPSQLYRDQNILKAYAWQEEKPKMIVSTGMITKDLILYGSEWATMAWLVMACNSVYPHEQPYGLGIIHDLIRLRGSDKVGYSSHDTGDAVLPAIIAGAEYIERHFTLNKHMKGSDHSTVSSTFEEIQKLMAQIESIEKMLGHKESLPFDEEIMAKRYIK